MHGAKKFEALKNFSDWVPLSCPKLNPEPKISSLGSVNHFRSQFDRVSR